MTSSIETKKIYLTTEEQQRQIGADTFFEDYRFFKRPNTDILNKSFVASNEYAPSHSYPALRELHGGNGDFLQRKHDAHKAIMELEANRVSGALPYAEYVLATGYHEKQLRKMLLTEEARNLHSAGASSSQEVARNEFNRYNQELYGDVDKTDFSAMMNTEKARVQEFVPRNGEAQRIHNQLTQYFDSVEVVGEERDLMSLEDLAKLREVLLEQFGDVLEIVPTTDETVKYDADQIADIFRQALNMRGLTDKGWTVRVDEKTSVTDTDAQRKEIVLPAALSRTASEVQRLLIHEFGVHVMRGQNGDETGIAALKTGTANYGDVEEGEGVLFECALAGNFDNASFYRARDRYIVAGLALGTDGAEGQDFRRDARQVFEIAWRLFAVRGAKDGVIDDDVIAAAQTQAMTHVDNAFRSTNFAGRGVIYRKLKMYFEGLKKNAEYFSRHSDDMNAAVESSMVGKHDHTDETDGGEKQMVRELIKAA